MTRRVLGTVFFVAFANFVVSILFTLLIGGDANAGRVQDGRYYVGQSGRLTEVSAAAFNFSLWQTRSVWVTHPIGLAAAFLAYRQRARERRRI